MLDALVNCMNIKKEYNLNIKNIKEWNLNGIIEEVLH